ncbi:MAG: hypothetical protein AAF487_03550 [Bacteroidota bacterium]
MIEFFKLVGFGLFAAVKFLFTPPAMIYAGYGILVTFSTTMIGATTGAVTFFYGGKGIIAAWERLFPPKKKKKFTKGNRRIIRIKQNFGLWGFCFTAVILSIPVAGILLAKFFSKGSKTIPVFIIVLAIWTIVLTTIFYFFKDALAPYFE